MSVFAQQIASLAGVGRLPLAPGTWASAFTLVAAYALRGVSLGVMAGIALMLAVVGTWAAHLAAAHTQEKDASWIVIDEVLGMWCSVMFIARDQLLQLVAAFALFRAFDMLKPWPISWADKHVHGGVGIMLDDVMAGAITAIILAVAF